MITDGTLKWIETEISYWVSEVQDGNNYGNTQLKHLKDLYTNYKKYAPKCKCNGILMIDSLAKECGEIQYICSSCNIRIGVEQYEKK